MLATQIVTGVVLAMHYTPHVDFAFNSVEHIMRDVNYGWLLRYVHANGASMFFLAGYIHMFRGMYYGSYKEPREVLWILGVILLLLMIMTGFMGYVLPWGQMSYWAAVVITNLFSAIPIVGESITQWLWGGFAVGNPTLNRFYALHYLLPFVIAGVVVLHVWALHVVGQNNPDGIEPRQDSDTVAFTPYATIKDGFFLTVFLILFAWFVFYVPNYLGHPDNYIPANPSVTPTHIVPEWYYLPFYAILRAVPSKLGGVALLGASIVILAFLPWLDTLEGALGALPAALPLLLLAVLHHLRRPGLARLEAGGRHLRLRRARADDLLLRALPGDPAAARPLRGDAAGAELDHRIGAQARQRAPAVIAFAVALAGLVGLSSPSVAAEADTPPKLKWSFGGPFGQVRPRAAAARLQGLSRGLPDLSRSLSGGVPQSRRAGWSGLHLGAGRRGRRRIPGAGRSRRSGRGQGSRRPGSPTASRRRSRTTTRRARATTRCRPTSR